MALTIQEEAYTKKQYLEYQVAESIKLLNSIATDQINIKRAEIKAIQDKLIEDVATEKAKLVK